MGKRVQKDDYCPPGYRWVYARYIRRNGKIVYPSKGTCFRFLVKANQSEPKPEPEPSPEP